MSIDDVRQRQILADLHDALIADGRSGDASVILQDEFRLLMKQVTNLTPPKGLGQAARQQGENAIRRDLSKLFTPIDDEMLNIIGSQFGVDGIDQWITDAGGDKKHLMWDKLDPTGDGMAQFHTDNLDSRGRARNLKHKSQADVWYSPYVVSKNDFAPFLARLISHVGRRKAAWAAVYVALGGRVQQWIARHIPSPNSRFFQSNDPLRPSLTAENSAPGIGDDQHIVHDAQRARLEALTKRIKLMISGYSKDVASGIRPRKHAKATPISE